MKKSEFRFNNYKKHPAYIYREKNNVYHSITITHSPKTNRKKNIKLYKNPNPKDNSDSYLVKNVVKNVDKESYSKFKYTDWSFHKFDKRNVKRIKKGK